MKIAIQGITGSFHHEAALRYFTDTSVELVECLDFRSVFDAVKRGTADYGVVAVENSLHGPINQVYRLLAEHALWISGEVRLHIGMCLIGTEPAEINTLNAKTTVVSSHFAALAQCENWLNTNLAKATIQECPDTALAVRDLMAVKNSSHFAIASKHAALLHGGVVVAEHINDDPENYTRFFIISREKQSSSRANRTSIILHENISDRPGLLHEALGIFNDANVNLSKLDSHPKPGRERSYSFYIDFDVGIDSPVATSTLHALTTAGWRVQTLGSYEANDQPAQA